MQLITNLTFLALLFLSHSASAVNEYTENGRTVLVSLTPLEGTSSELSNTKCVEYTAGGSSDFKKACFDTIYNQNGVFVACNVAYDDMKCSSCKACITTGNPPVVGYEVDCFNKVPEKTTKSSCTPLEDSNLQALMVFQTQFQNTMFVFEEATDEATEAPGTDVQSTSNASVVSKIMVAAGAALGTFSLSFW